MSSKIHINLQQFLIITSLSILMKMLWITLRSCKYLANILPEALFRTSTIAAVYFVIRGPRQVRFQVNNFGLVLSHKLEVHTGSKHKTLPTQYVLIDFQHEFKFFRTITITPLSNESFLLIGNFVNNVKHINLNSFRQETPKQFQKLKNFETKLYRIVLTWS